MKYSVLQTEFHLILFCSYAKGAYTPLVKFCASSSGSHCTRGSGSTQGPRSLITLPVSSQCMQPESSRLVVARPFPTVHMSWAGPKWLRSLTASAGTSGAQFCWLSPRIWPCFSFWMHTVKMRRERERPRNGWKESDRDKSNTEGLKERDGRTKKDGEKRKTKIENQSGKKWVIVGDREKGVERVWNARREFNLFFRQCRAITEMCLPAPTLSISDTRALL